MRCIFNLQIEYDEKVEKYFSNFDLMKKKIGNDMTETIKNVWIN